MATKYKVWVRVSVEEIIEDEGAYRNVTEDESGELVEDTDPYEFSLHETTDYQEARDIANDVESLL